MLKRAYLIIYILVLLFASMAVFAYGGGDTGAYRISQYVVALTPMQDGTTKIEYYQKWIVTGGHIPWITVGVPNDDYNIVSSSLAVSNASTHNSGQESMVRLDLDQDYLAGESFEIQFTINQRQLFQKSNKGYTISFTPGWYDRACVDSMEIRLNSLCSAYEATAQPTPSYQNSNAIVWSGITLSAGNKYPVSITFPKAYAPNAVCGSGKGRANIVTSPLVFPIIIVTVLAISYFVKRSLGMDDYTGGGIFHGGGHGGSCYVSSCACACAGCACACACAGGGGAGCSRKNEHICPACKERNEDSATRVHPDGHG